MAAKYVRVTLTIGQGHFGTVGRATTLIDLRGVTVPIMDKGGKGLFCEDGDTVRAHRFEVSLEQMQAIASALESMDFTTDGPKVDAVVDTSDLSTDYLLDVVLDDKSRRFSLFEMQSGLEGAHAEPFRALIALLLEIAR